MLLLSLDMDGNGMGEARLMLTQWVGTPLVGFDEKKPTAPSLSLIGPSTRLYPAAGDTLMKPKAA